MPLTLNVIQKKFCVLQKKVLSFGPNRTVEVRPNSSAEPNVWLITSVHILIHFRHRESTKNSNIPGIDLVDFALLQGSVVERCD